MEKQGAQFNVKDYFGIVLRRKYTVLLIVAGIFAPLVFYVRSRHDTYFTQAQLVIEESKSSGSMLMPAAMRTSRAFNFYQGIFRSRSYLLAIVDTLTRPRFAPFVKDTSLTALSDFVARSISLQKAQFDNFINLSATATAPGLTYEMARAATTIFIERCREVVAEESENALKEINNQLLVIREKLEVAERDFRGYRDRFGDATTGAASELKLLQEKYFELKSEKASRDALYEANKRLLSMLEERIEPKSMDREGSETYKKAKSELAKKEKEKKRLESLGLTLNPSSPVFQDIDKLEKEIVKYGGKETERPDPKVVSQWQKMRNVVAEDEMALDVLENKIAVYDKKIVTYKRKNPHELEQALDLVRLERSRKVYEDTYNILLEQAELAKIRRASETGGLKIIDEVYFPHTPVPKNEAVFYLVGAAFALFLGIGFVILLESFDTSVKSYEELEGAYDIPIIGTIPHIELAKKEALQIRRRSSDASSKEVVTHYPRELVDFYKDESIIAESYRSLRTNLFFTSPDHPIRAMIVTSPGPHEGKSLTACNLSLACAQMGKKVVLIDADLRRPVAHHLFQVAREPGFTDLFIGKLPHEVVKSTGLTNLSLITAGRFTPNPSELLGSKRIEKVIDLLKETYDLVVFDTPPVMAVTDAALLTTKVDGTLLVVKSYSTDRNVLERAVASIQNVNARIIGFILNDINLSHGHMSSGYYKYYYHYYRSQKD